jgi:ubiquitin carboxyl-terminal hydrolase 4/11/15
MCEVQASSDLTVGEMVYLISNKWLSRVQARGTGAKSRQEDLEGEIGPVDNSDIVQETITDHEGLHFARLRPELPRDAYTLFPENAWNYVVKLYGLSKGTAPILRVAHNTNPDQTGLPNIQYEMHPPLLTVHRLWSANSPIPISQILKAKNPLSPVFVMSRGDRYVDLLRKMKKAADIEVARKIRVWRIPQSLSAGEQAKPVSNELSPPPSRSTSPDPSSQAQLSPWPNLLVEVDLFLKLQKGTQRELLSTPDHSSNVNYNGSMTVEMADLGADQALVLDEVIEKDSYISNYVASKDSGSVPITSIRNSKTQSDSGRSSPAPSSTMMTRGRTSKTGRTIGAVGLSNLGNTCYMNSALQCVRSVEELTKYFLADVAEEELNPDNPLGNNGEVARVYGGLLHEMFRDPAPISISPRQFKNTIGRCAPSFSGYGQQDSQEFLGFLLDGLQEDLSRIKKKPYIEKPDSTDEMVGNAEAIREMAAKVWDITKKRDDSVIADLFTGMYKSTLVCPVCDKVSITFDPFNNLTLQLPIENAWNHDVYYFPLSAPPIRITVDMDKNGSIKALKQFISKRVEVPVERLFIAEEWKCRFYKFYDETKTVSDEISSNDRVAVYELDAAPTNWPPVKKPAKQKVKSMLNFNSYNNDSDDDEIPTWDDPISQTMVVPVLHRVALRDDRPGRLNNRKKYDHIACPHFITLTPQEVCLPSDAS